MPAICTSDDLFCQTFGEYELAIHIERGGSERVCLQQLAIDTNIWLERGIYAAINIF